MNDKSHLSYVLNYMFPGPFIPNFSLYLTLTVIALANSLHPVPTPPYRVLSGHLVLLLTEVLEG